MAAQIVHAAGESIIEPLPKGTNAVVLSVRDEPELRRLDAELSAAGIRHAAIVEVDLPHEGQMTALGLFPVLDRGPARKLLSSLPLLKINTLPRCDASLARPEAEAPCAGSSEVEHQE